MRGKPFCGGGDGGGFGLEARVPCALVSGVFVALLAKTTTMFDSLADYPRWFVVACGTVVAAVAIWLMMKLLKLTMWLLIGAVLAVGLGTAAWLLVK